MNQFFLTTAEFREGLFEMILFHFLGALSGSAVSSPGDSYTAK